MARIVLSAILNDIRNQIGTNVFSVWRGINYIRSKANRVTNPNSSDQGAIRARITEVSRRWFSVLTQDQHEGWEEWAQTYGVGELNAESQGSINIIPTNRKVMSGFNAFLMINMWGFSAETLAFGFFTDDAPAGIPGPGAPTSLVCSYDDLLKVVNLTWDDPPGMGIDDRIRIWGRSLSGGAHKQLIASTGPGISPNSYAVEFMKYAKGAERAIFKQPGNYCFQIDTVSDIGQKSSPTGVVCCLVEITLPPPPP